MYREKLEKDGGSVDLNEIPLLIDEYQQALAEKDRLIESLKQEAQIHAQEARTANHTIAEIYQVVSGKTGEPGNWRGAEPVKQLMAQQIATLREALEGIMEIGKRDMTNPKYDGYFELAQQALKESYSERKKNG